MSGRFFILLFSLLWLWLIHWTQASAFWRDSGEFIIAGRYLDVSHPGGFPLYGMLSNVFAILPIGPIAFRINAFSTCIAALFLALTAQNAALTIRILKPKISTLVAGLTSVAPIFMLLSSESLVKQALTAEVYVLNGLLLALLYWAFLQWRSSHDIRWLITIPFLAALTLGNHAASGVALVPAAIIVLCATREKISRYILPAVAVAILGLALYAYIPVRALSHPPLNTGNASNLSRFLIEITDGRDRALRSDPAQNDLAVVQSAPSIERFAITVLADVEKLAAELSWVLLACGAAGLILLLFSAPALGLLLWVLGIGTWYFFQGWDPDPWMPLFSALAIGSSVLLAWLGTRIPALHIIAALGLIGCGVARIQGSEVIPMAEELASYEEPASSAARMLRSIPAGTPLLCEPAWFFLKFARDIEGVGEESTLLYQPSVLYPGYFAFPTLELPSKKFLISPPETSSSPNTKFASKLISSLAQFGPIGIEAGSLNQFVAKVVEFKGNGALLLDKGISGGFEEEFIRSTISPLKRSLATNLSAIPSTGGDARHFAELKAVTTADLLAQAGKLEAAASLLSDLCAPLDESSCGEVALNNIGNYLNRVGKFGEARKVLEYLLERGTSQRAAVEENLRIADAGAAKMQTIQNK